MYLFPTEAPLRRSSPAVSGKTIHPHTCIRNEIISLPPWAVISQPRCLDGPSHTPGAGMQKRKGWGRCGTGTVELQGKLGNIPYQRGRGMKKESVRK